MLFLAVLVPIYALLVLSTGAYLRSLQKEAVDHTQAMLDLNVRELEEEMNRIDRYYFNLEEKNVAYQEILDWEDSSADRLACYQIFHEMVDQNSLTMYPEALTLYLEEKDELLFTQNAYLTYDRNALQQSLQTAREVHQPQKWKPSVIGGRSYLIHTIGYDGVYLGVLIDLQDIMDGIRGQSSYDGVRVLASSKRPDADFADLVCSTGIAWTDTEIFVLLGKGEVSAAMPMISRIALIVGLILLIFLPILLILLSTRLIIRPTQVIVNGMAHLAMGEPDYRIPEIRAADEFVWMRNSFNNMASELQNLRIAKYEEQLEREQMMLQNLLLQIRPHFLLNFFNVIYSMAQLKDYRGIQKSCLYLSRFFRYLFHSDKTAPLKEELELVDGYLELMEEQYPGCFTLEEKVDEDLLDYRVPPLIVQNFVENIFKYAVSDSNIITITISLQRESGYVVMGIADDGPGMEEETLEAIRAAKPIEKKDGTHIGIYNSTYRLKKLCGEDCRLEVASVLTEGTLIRILLPEEEGRKSPREACAGNRRINADGGKDDSDCRR